MKEPCKLAMVIPCFNEEEALKHTCKKLHELCELLIDKHKISKSSVILFVDDGSSDNTWQEIIRLSEKYTIVNGLKLAHNVGHQNALWAGLMTVKDDFDAAISMDADLQDDVCSAEKFLDEYYYGSDIVYGVRSSRKKDTFFKKNTARAYYSIMNKLGVDLIPDHADYRLMSKRSLQALSKFGETNLFLRGMVRLLGFKTTKVYYERGERVAGESKYPLKKMLSFAWQGILSFSIKPISIIVFLGLLCCVIGIVVFIWMVITMVQGNSISGWASTMMSIWILGGSQLVALGIVGQYIGKIYLETKKRPRFIVEENTLIR